MPLALSVPRGPCAPITSQMDIEGFEYDALGAMLSSAAADSGAAELLPRQMAVEMHYKTRFRELPWFGRYKSAGEIATFMDALYRYGGYHLIDRHDNPFCKHCTETLLVRYEPQARPPARASRLLDSGRRGRWRNGMTHTKSAI